ncbi:MAG: leucine-rich repeat domain-containing protein [Cyanobacteriota bacterium]
MLKPFIRILKYLFLEYNQITDFSPLAGLTNLKHLVLEGNPIPLDSSQGAQPTCPIRLIYCR